MSLKKQSKKKKGIKLSANLKACITLLIIMIVLIPIIVYKLSADKGDYYKIESRINKVKDNEIIENSNYITIGWLRVQGTKLDLPIVYSEVDEDFPVQLEEFVWSENKDEKFHNMIKISGHNIFNLSATPKKESKLFKRFEELMAFVYYDFAKENQYIQLTLNNEEHLYQIFSVGIIEYKDISKISPGNYSDKDLKNNIKFFEKESIYNYNISVDSEDKLISLITCTKMYGTEEDVQMIITGKKVNNKKRNLEKVVKNNNYKKVEKSLKGADTNENV